MKTKFTVLQQTAAVLLTMKGVQAAPPCVLMCFDNSESYGQSVLMDEVLCKISLPLR